MGTIKRVMGKLKAKLANEPQDLIKVSSEDTFIFVTYEVLTTWFSCDYSWCRGACCWVKHPTEKLAGGIVLPQEKDTITKVYTHLFGAMGHNINEMFDQHEGYYTTVLDAEDRCVFCGEIGCHLKGTQGTDIPVHCELYPISACYETGQGATVLRFDRLFEQWCEPSFKKGKSENVTLIEFEKRPLTRLFGERMYEQLRLVSRTLIEGFLASDGDKLDYE